MRRYVAQSAAGCRLVFASSPRQAALQAFGTTERVIVWYATDTGYASWVDGCRTRHAGKASEPVETLLGRG